MPVGSATLLFLTLPGALLRNLPDLVRLRLLGLVRVIRARVDLELAQRLTAERVLRQHALDGLLHHARGVLGHQVAIVHRAQATRVTGVAVSLLLLELGAAEGD